MGHIFMELAAVEGGERDDWAERTYDAYAPVYDVFTAHYDYDGWLADLVALLERHGLSGRRLLDVGCGTGKSFLSLLPKGWQVTGCDISASMLDLAREKVGERAHLVRADMRALPVLGEFDLVWALDDAVNYMLDAEELRSALAGMRSNLAPAGLLLFDVNALHAYRTFFAETDVVEREGHRLVWRGLTAPDVAPGSICESRLEIDPDRPGENASECVHRQRHFPEAEVLAALAQAGLECLGVYGQGLDGIPRQPLDEAVHTKAVYVARAAQSAT
jgi:SAM-dependent methyltransferase